MTSTPSSDGIPAGGTPHGETTGAPTPWGHQHPHCKGEAAVAFFTADLARTIELHLAQQAVTEETLALAQQAVDRLLRIYVALGAAPHAFDGQSVTLDIAYEPLADGGRAPYVALRTSQRLEDMIIELQERERSGLA